MKKELTGAEATRTQLQPSKPKREITNITNSQNTMGTYGQPSEPLSPTDSALARTDLSPLTNGIWEINAGCSCTLHLHLLAKIG